uniref:Uncharacterized protein n=1 Tax=Anguilla anguilla TaxID=7936 RepID=A0A0E9RSA2_ANGAN
MSLLELGQIRDSFGTDIS